MEVKELVGWVLNGQTPIYGAFGSFFLGFAMARFE